MLYHSKIDDTMQKITPDELEVFRKQAFAEYSNFHKRDRGFTRLGVDSFGDYVIINNGKKYKFVNVEDALDVYYVFLCDVKTRFVQDCAMVSIFSFESSIELPRSFILQMEQVRNIEQTPQDGGGYLVEIVYIRKDNPRRIYDEIISRIGATDIENV